MKSIGILRRSIQPKPRPVFIEKLSLEKAIFSEITLLSVIWSIWWSIKSGAVLKTVTNLRSGNHVISGITPMMSRDKSAYEFSEKRADIAYIVLPLETLKNVEIIESGKRIMFKMEMICSKFLKSFVKLNDKNSSLIWSSDKSKYLESQVSDSFRRSHTIALSVANELIHWPDCVDLETIKVA